MITPSSPPKPAYRGENTDSFAHPTVFKRWPVILDQVVDDLRQHLRGKSSGVYDEITQIQNEIRDRLPMPFLAEDDEPDCQQWNDALRMYFPHTTYSQASWLFSECYLYRRIWNIIRCYPETSNYDPFLFRKQSSMSATLPKMLTAANRLLPLLSSPSATVTRDLLLMSLWGNATDLSMFAGLTQSQMHTMSAGSGEDDIICNNLDHVCRYIGKIRNGHIDFILDNNGFELFGDFLLADHLHRIGAASRTVFHCKAIPWFISDTTPSDFEALLSTLENPPTTDPNGGSDINDVRGLAKTWRGYLARGEWVLKPNHFWTSWWAYRHLPDIEPSLFSDLAASTLVFFKGDLNYRKLIYDCRWPSNTPFREAIGDALASKLRLVALRTSKSDPCVGLAEGQEAELVAARGKDWRWSGKVAVVQFSQPSHSIRN